MFDASELRGRIAKSGLSQRKVAKQMGITPKTFYCKMRSGGFQVAELDRIAEIIGMKRSEIAECLSIEMPEHFLCGTALYVWLRKKLLDFVSKK